MLVITPGTSAKSMVDGYGAAAPESGIVITTALVIDAESKCGNSIIVLFLWARTDEKD